MDVGEIVDGGEYVGESFTSGVLKDRTIVDVRFDECTFEGIDASMARLVNCRLAECRWRGVKAVGVDWTLIDQPSMGLHTALDFEDCHLDYGVFAGMVLAGSRFVACRVLEGAFAGCDLREVDLRWSQLEGSDFAGARMESANLAGASGYAIDPTSTRVKDLRVSHPDAESFLAHLGLVVVPAPERDVDD